MIDPLLTDDQLANLLAEIPEGNDGAPPRIVLGLHKSGSTMLTGLFQRLLKSLNAPLINLARSTHERDILPRIWEHDLRMQKLFRPGVSYLGFRGLPKFMDADFIATSRMIVLVRDPRDALVSGYFSFAPGGSHVPAPGARMRAEQDAARKADEGLDIDQWILKHMGRFERQFRDILPLQGMAAVKIYRYEDVLFDKVTFLQDALAHLQVKCPLPRIQRLIEREAPLPSVENPKAHIRKGTPGDHREKLKPETIAALNDKMAEPLKAFGYLRG